MFGFIKTRHLGDGAVWTVVQGAKRCYNAFTNIRSQIFKNRGIKMEQYRKMIKELIDYVVSEKALKMIYDLVLHFIQS